MSKCIGYCEEKTGPTYQHPEHSGDVLCGECLLNWWQEDWERWYGEMTQSIEDTGLDSDLVKVLEQVEI
ncbi:MAG: hypothetical protein DRQ35_04835 [Gammaproteobacteria bacterium]|nr:MAG: hypothetical protein DRQ35_04835 [Gammaproteobacteria bacterium]